MQILSVGSAHPDYYYDQDELLSRFKEAWGKQHHNVDRVDQFHRAVCVGGRYLALPIDQYENLTGFGDANDAFIREGLVVAEQAIQQALDEAGLQPSNVDAIFFTTVTGIATPSLDARLINRMGFRNDIKRYPFFGLGCVAGAAGIARLNDYLQGHPNDVALLVSVELCSLTLQRDDLSVANLISSGLFGDGAAAVIAVGSAHAATDSSSGPKILATQSRFYPNSERIMGWDITETGFKIVLSDSVPAVVHQYIRDDVDSFLNAHKLSRQDINFWICHPGGPKILEAFEDCLELPGEALQLTWNSLREVGNLSSASVLLVLQDTIKKRTPQTGDYGLLLAMGPGFCSEIVLLRW